MQENTAENIKHVELFYFAHLREATKKSKETWKTKAATAEELFEEINQEYSLPLSKGQIMVAINDQYQKMDSKIVAGDTVVFIPPVAGG